MKICWLDPSTEPAYERFLLSADCGLLYYSLRYRDFLVDMLGCQARYLLALGPDGEITGCLPMMDMTGPFGRVVNSLPFFGSHGGALAADDDVRALLWSEWHAITQQEDVAAATVVLHPFLPEPAGLSHDFIDERIGFITDLSVLVNIESDLMDAIESSTRRNIRKAQALGIEALVDNSQIGFLEQVHNENMMSMGGVAKSRNFFEKIQQYFRPGIDYDIYVARYNGNYIAGLLILYFNGTVEYFMPVVRHENRSDQPLSVILIKAMADAARNGFLRWNWGGSWPGQESLQRFKRKWAGIPHPYRYFVSVNNRRILASNPIELAALYPSFYVVPYSVLASTQETGDGA